MSFRGSRASILSEISSTELRLSQDDASYAQLTFDPGRSSLGEWEALTAKPEVFAALQTADTWKFDAFRLAEVTEQRPLSTLGFWILRASGLIEEHGENLCLTLPLLKIYLWNQSRS